MKINDGIAEMVKKAGVVGAGGAGFPTHVKMQSSVDTVIANGVECEPLLANDKTLMINYPESILKGLDILAQSVGAKRKIIALKKKYSEPRAAFEKEKSGAEILDMPDYYPAGDEVEIVKKAMGKTVPPGGLPLHIGAVVNNVETLHNIAQAAENIPVTDKYITVCGEVAVPSVLKVPVGALIADVISACGGAKIEHPAIYTGGPMMGEISSPDSSVTKTTSGIFVLPEDHYLINIRSIRMEYIIRQAQAVCTDCKLCTDICPRYLLGHDIEPHKIMRVISHQMINKEREADSAYLCCFCGACEYACPVHLSPRRVYVRMRDMLISEGIEFAGGEGLFSDHPNRVYRRIPSKRLVSRLGLSKYDKPVKFDESTAVSLEKVVIPLKQHIGLPALPVIRQGARVIKGELIAEIPEGKLGANIHASIDGRVSSVDDINITLEAE